MLPNCTEEQLEKVALQNTQVVRVYFSEKQTVLSGIKELQNVHLSQAILGM